MKRNNKYPVRHDCTMQDCHQSLRIFVTSLMMNDYLKSDKRYREFPIAVVGENQKDIGPAMGTLTSFVDLAAAARKAVKLSINLESSSLDPDLDITRLYPSMV